ncbi:hypothetical protein T459_01201 [Capsicum annuum]|uniref:FBD domain-containing protein n=1 Tax=Capsicum annuum TaxID=4072 RepID=A0A2G3AGF7_CAPAN|nr:hypothetical protein T459_01201 [Capsicum annuum]
MPCLMELNIGGYLLESLKMGGLPENHLIALNNVKSLTIRRVLFRNVEEGNMDYDVEPAVQYLRDQSRLHGVVKLLQRVHMNGFNGSKMEMEFLRLILACAPVLEKISIWNYARLMYPTGTEIMDELNQVRRASPNVEFIVDAVELEDDIPIEPPDFVLEDDFDE